MVAKSVSHTSAEIIQLSQCISLHTPRLLVVLSHIGIYADLVVVVEHATLLRHESREQRQQVVVVEAAVLATVYQRFVCIDWCVSQYVLVLESQLNKPMLLLIVFCLRLLIEADGKAMARIAVCSRQDGIIYGRLGFVPRFHFGKERHIETVAIDACLRFDNRDPSAHQLPEVFILSGLRHYLLARRNHLSRQVVFGCTIHLLPQLVVGLCIYVHSTNVYYH